MENNYYENQSTQNLVITEVVKDYLLETAKWAKFIAIIGFIGIGFMILFALFFGTLMGALGAATTFSGESGVPLFMGGFFTVFYILIILLYFFPIKYLYDFSTKVKNAIQINDQQLFTEAILKLKAHYKYIGILMMVVLGLYAIGIIISIVGGLAAATLM